MCDCYRGIILITYVHLSQMVAYKRAALNCYFFSGLLLKGLISPGQAFLSHTSPPARETMEVAVTKQHPSSFIYLFI